MTRREATIVSAYTGYFIGELNDLYKYLSELIDIRLRFPQDGFPTIEVTRSHASRRYLDILNKEERV